MANNVSPPQDSPDPELHPDEIRRQLDSAITELETLAHFISHDLRAPLRGIEGYSQALLEDYAGQLDDVGQAYLVYIHDSARSASLLIERLVRYARIQRGPFQPEPVDLSEIARQELERLQKLDPARGLNFDLQPGLEAQADAYMMKNLLGELLENAWKFTAPCSHAVIRFFAGQIQDERVFRIADNGAGFNMAYVQKLFQPFQRLHGVHEFSGTGLGLAICRRIVERHGGRIWIEGSVGDGATVSFTLPQVEHDEETRSHGEVKTRNK